MVDLNRSVSAKYTMEQSQASGMAGLQQLASFGRFGANVLHECQVAALREIRAETVRPSGFNLAAASISSFYSWAARQPQHTVSFQSTSRTPPAPLKHQVDEVSCR